jgi:hypothetical protein
MSLDWPGVMTAGRAHELLALGAGFTLGPGMDRVWALLQCLAVISGIPLNCKVTCMEVYTSMLPGLWCINMCSAIHY